MIETRRALLTGLLGFVAMAPAIVRASSLMAIRPFRSVWSTIETPVPKWTITFTFTLPDGKVLSYEPFPLEQTQILEAVERTK